MPKMQEEFKKTYTSFSGCDILASFNGIQIGELQAITYSVSREKAPIYTMGSAEPRSFSRGKRGIAGTLVFTVFDRDALTDEFKGLVDQKNIGIQKFKANANQGSGAISIEDWDAQMNSYSNTGSDSTASGTTGTKTADLVTTVAPVYADEILPFDITITFANEYGQRASLAIYGVELLNEGSGYSIDSVTTEKAYTFVARRIDNMKPVTNESDVELSTTF